MYPQDFLFLFHGFLCFLVYGSSISHTRRGLGAGVTQVVDFDCPEEFGYYPHPTDCTQYYVCVFGGALLESCTGGLMYSHELQTCDWPRNVGCGVDNNNNSGNDGSTISTLRVTDPRTRNPQSSVSIGPQQSPVLQPVTPRPFQRQDFNRSRQHEVIQQHFYTDDLGPAEEIESDRQQRVYRGQPSSLGQVQRDRDGLRQINTNVYTPNVIPTSTGEQDKISVVSFGSQRPSAPRPQEQYRNLTVDLTDCIFNTIDDDCGNDDDGDGIRAHDLTEKILSRTKRQVYARPRYLQTNSEPFQQFAVITPADGNNYRNLNLVSTPSDRGVAPVIPSPFARPLGFYKFQPIPAGRVIKFTEPNLQTGFKPMLQYVREQGSAEVSRQAPFTRSPLVNTPQIRFVTGSPFMTKPAQVESQPAQRGFYSTVRFLPTPVNPNAAINATTYRSGGRYLFRPSTTLGVTPPRYYQLTTPGSQYYFTTAKPSTPTTVKPVNYLPHWLDASQVIYGDNGSNEGQKYLAHTPEYQFPVRRKPPKPFQVEKGKSKVTTEKQRGDKISNEQPRQQDRLLLTILKDIRNVIVGPKPEMTSQKTSFPIKGFYVTDATLAPPTSGDRTTATTIGYKVTDLSFNGLYSTVRPYQTDKPSATEFPVDGDFIHSQLTLPNTIENGSRIEQVQAHQLTSALPPQTPSPRPIERYNNSQRFQPDQYDQYYAVYDDIDIYRQNGFNHQHYQTPSSTPASSIAHQYRGSTNHKQALELERIQELERVQEPVQQQQHRNAYTQDIYSPPPAVQDFNDQYNAQIDDQQQYHLTQSTPKLPSRSERTNATKDALPEPSTTVTRAPENVTTKYEPPSSPIIRRSDSNSYFSISSFGPSTVLLPPLRYDETTRKYFNPDYTTTTKNEKQLYSSLIPALRDGGRNSFEPPKNGGALAKTFNSFDSLLSSFIAAVTGSPTASPGPSTTPPTPHPPKSSPETIVRSEIGRIHHDPIVITENFTIRLPNYRKPEEPKPPLQTTLVVPLPPPSSTPAPPPPLAQNDYLAYFVEIEPKKPKTEDSTKRGGFFVNVQPEGTTESKPQSAEPGNFRQENFEPKPKPYSDFVRLVSNGQNQKVRLGTTLDLEPIAKPEETPESEVSDAEKERTGARGYQPVGKWVIAKDGKTGTNQAPLRQSSFDSYQEERPRDTVNFRESSEIRPEPIERERVREVEAIPQRGNENLVQNHPAKQAEIPPTTIVSGPYKFLYVDLDTTTEELSSPAPFGRNPGNEERNRFAYKTNPESRVRGRFYEKPRDSSLNREPETEDPTTEAPVAYNQNYRYDDSIKFIYKTHPESRIRNRYLGSSEFLVNDDKKLEEPEVTPKIIVPEFVKPEEEEVVVPTIETVALRESPIQVLPKGTESEEAEGEAEVEPPTQRDPEPIQTRRRKPDFRYKTIEIESSSRKPLRYKSTTEAQETDLEPETEPVSNEEDRKSLPRRVIKIQRNELKGQRFSGVSKLKRFRKPTTKLPTSPAPSSPSPSPIIVLQELEEKTLSKENEIHPSYRPIVVTETQFPAKNKSRFRFTVEDKSDFADDGSNKIGFSSTTEKIIVLEKGKSGFFSPISDPENDLPEKEVTDSGNGFPTASPKRPLTFKNVTQYENRATTKAYRGKFKPSDGLKLRLKLTTATPDSESTPGPHLSTRQPGGYTIGSTGNEVTLNRGTPVPNRGTRPTLKPSTAIVSKASEFIDIYRYPPRRPQNLYATPTPDKSAAKCRKDVCLLPDCNCGGKDIPGGYNAEEIPQLVLLTFDDSVNDLNKGLYADLFERGRVNPNGCPISATFYVSHEWTDYSQVQNLYANGHEIASHSITHSFGEQFSQKKWTKEIAGQREILAAYGGVRLEDIRGMRAPFLAVGGNKMFKMLYDSNFTYDSSMPIYENRPPSWPYTLDYKLFHDCMIPPCPTKSYPGVWEVPMVMWQDLNGGRCSMGDACSNPPTADGVYKMLIKNFERHFTTNRAPFGLYYHAAWFTHEHHKEGFIAFLDTIVNMPEVWLVTTTQAIEWVRDPQPLSTVNSFPPFQCNVEKAKKCNNPKVCNLWHKSGVRYMRTCQPCPDVYPWTGKTGVKNSRVDNDISEE